MPTVSFFDDPEPVYDEIGEASVALTPHRFAKRDEARLLPNGKYNVNWVYVKNNIMGMGFLKEWASLCLDWCFYRNEGDRFGDQKYLDSLAVKYNAHDIQHPGVNLAPWNQGQYNFRLADGRLYVGDYPVALYHFHEFEWCGGRPRLTGWQIHPAVQEHIYQPYVETYRKLEKQLDA